MLGLLLHSTEDEKYGYQQFMDVDSNNTRTDSQELYTDQADMGTRIGD